MSDHHLETLAQRWRNGRNHGIASICSAHPWVIEAALRASPSPTPVLIEATCNQVNQDGGYTGMTPRSFRDFVAAIAERAGFDTERLIFGGDHLGPNPWKHLPADEAMRRAEKMVEAYVEAGFTKIHIDASMGCRGEPAALGDAIVAERATRLVVAAERAAEKKGTRPVYVIGTEVPTPGGATHAISNLAVTSPEAATATLAAHRSAFSSAGISAVFARVIAIVVQPGVEFTQDRVVAYDPTKATRLRNVIDAEPSIVFEAHSTDYQTPAALSALVRDGFPILKVGPGLTFAMREALYGLDCILAERDPRHGETSLRAAMEQAMLADPVHWQGYSTGPADTQRLERHYGYSDRIRYYWPLPRVQKAVGRLMAAVGAMPIPESLISQFLPRCYPAVRAGALEPQPMALVLQSIRLALDPYLAATIGGNKQETGVDA